MVRICERGFGLTRAVRKLLAANQILSIFRRTQGIDSLRRDVFQLNSPFPRTSFEPTRSNLQSKPYSKTLPKNPLQWRLISDDQWSQVGLLLSHGSRLIRHEIPPNGSRTVRLTSIYASLWWGLCCKAG
ncbi:hypothetical protein AVEN_203121-1 [Araneus ventricosus]|uniref:Uncharacterized protein n=1 Tax=Araneus ventricosus TaxID=182803 RepID=A0A4Y2DSN7_ARAVE|nr:hypothetical protein AVEN_203121-1 [Araneus ventricosus]